MAIKDWFEGDRWRPIGSIKSLKSRGQKLAIDYGIDQKATALLDSFSEVSVSAENAWGDFRQWMKQYPSPDTPEELLNQTREELLYVVACILQIPPRSAAKWVDRFGKTLTAKLAAAGITTSALGLVATFGTAGTGAAISGLSGAAATSATMAWVGGLLGGGMLAGSIMTGGVGLLVGYATFRMIGSKERSFKDLDPIDQEVVEACAFLADAMRESIERQESGSVLTAESADLLFKNTLKPLHEKLLDHTDDICSRLDQRNAMAFRQHALRDFKRVIIDGFDAFLNDHREKLATRNGARIEYAIGSVIYALSTQEALAQNHENQLVLEAFRRSDSELYSASESEIAEYISRYSPDQLKGIANNIKGIYYELSYVDEFNSTHHDRYAELFEKTNHPGADVQIRDRETNEILEAIQLKSTNNQTYISEHSDRYPDVRLEVTSDSLNEENSRTVHEALETLGDLGPGDEILGAGSLSGLVEAGRQALLAIHAKDARSISPKAIAEATATGGVTAAVVAFLFS